MAMQLKVNDNAFRIFYDEIHFMEEPLLSCLNDYKSINLYLYVIIDHLKFFFDDSWYDYPLKTGLGRLPVKFWIILCR